ncbi:hypothetical protein GRI89_14390 [Altererythrobacter salegens]|uniref:Glycosyltransferase RgtA/B/C/D-like domain-containing protein n=1 Tax=Croceibacterium salegens TaxID=1737568 RepID=A0A6I4SZ54_9SPHN|nr:hypothetical protein [Croceibacterium salegens]MXO60728.1 hypothetical protein [Croceibacterium salegens]
MDQARSTNHANTVKAPMQWRLRQATIDLVTFLMLLWPLILNGSPFYSADSGSYLRGGEFGFNTGLDVFWHWWDTTFVGSPLTQANDTPGVGAVPNGAQEIVQNAVAKSGGIRSVIYSLVAYFLRYPGSSLLALTICQAGAVTFVISCFRRLIFPNGHVWIGVAGGVGLSFLTTAPWYAAYAMPDICAGLTIGGAIILTIFFVRLSIVSRGLAVLLVTFGAITHDSHLPVAFITIAAGALLHFVFQPLSIGEALRRAIWFGSPLILAVSILFATSMAAFSQASLSPKHYPIPLARSVADGPGYWYLHEHCATEGYAICEVLGSNPPRNVGRFLWGADGVRHKATPEQMERIRAEEPIIIQRATMAYPMMQFSASLRNTARQFLKFGVGELQFGQSINVNGNPSLLRRQPDIPVIRTISEWLIYLGFCVSILSILVFWRKFERLEHAAIGVAIVGMLANAAVCGVLSAVTDRYQGRVAWILPCLVLFIVLRILSSGGVSDATWRRRTD